MAGLGAALLIAIGTISLIFHEKSEILEREQQKAETLTRLLDDGVTRIFTTADITLRMIADTLRESDGLDRNMLTLGRLMAQSIRSLPYVRSISILDDQGAVLASSSEKNLGYSINLSLIVRDIQLDEFRIGAPVSGKDVGDSAIALPPATTSSTQLIPLVLRFATKHISSVYAVAAIDPSFFSGYFSVALNDPTAGAAVLDLNGLILAVSTSLGALPGSRANHLAATGRLPAENQITLYSGIGLDGSESLSAFKRGTRWPIVTMVQLSRRKVIAEWIDVNRWLALAGFAIFLLSIYLTASSWRNLRSKEAIAAKLDDTFLKLLESERNYRLAVENLGEIVFRTDPSGNLTFLSSAWESISGSPVADALGRPLAGFFSEKDRDRVAHAIISARNDSPALEDVLMGIQSKDRRVSIIARPITGERQERAGTAGTIADISDRIAADKRNRDQVRFIAQLIESVPSAIYVKDSGGRFVMVNKTWEDLTGFNRAQISGKKISHLLSTQHDSDGFRSDDDLLNGAQRASYQSRITTASGLERDVIFSKACFFDESGQIAGLVGNLTDITELKDAENQIRIAKAAADDANRAKSEFLANVSHEIRTPLNGILGIAQLALESNLDRAQRESLEIIHSSGESLLNILNDVLDFSKIEAGKLDLESVKFSPSQLVYRIVRLLTTQSRGKSVELIVSVAPDIPELLVSDPHRVRQILINLLGNALKFTEHGEIELAVGRRDGSPTPEIVFSVRDTGPGIPKERQAKIFEAFTQADRSVSRRFGGTGLGLSISLRLAKLMNGRIELESLPGAGSTFRLVLPIAGAQPKAPTPMTLEGKRALIVVQNDRSAEILSALLSERGAKVYREKSAADAANRLSAIQADGIYLDWLFVDLSKQDEAGHDSQQQSLLDGAVSVSGIPHVVSIIHQSELTADKKNKGALTLIKPIIAPAIDRLIDDEGHARKTSLPTKTIINLRPARILVAEDHPVIQTITRRLLEKRGHIVSIVDNGKSAVDAAVGGAFDLVLMDMQMPELNGIDATALIRQSEKGSERHVPIVALTAMATSGFRDQCAAAGMDGYISKPVVEAELDRLLQRFFPPK